MNNLQDQEEYPGNLIVLYGVNNCGKTTQANMLVESVQELGYDAEHLKYPIYDINPSGEYINEVLRKGKKVSPKELQLWYALNRHQYEEQLFKKLQEGIVVIAEDYIGTGIAWGMAHGVPKETLREINKDLYPEDLGILLRGARYTDAVEKGHLHEEDDELVERCTEIHNELAAQYGWVPINAAQEKENVHKDIMRVVDPFLDL
ncbi:hypothetical protein KKH43_00850 [Patescibacteria group bacterium]|nr:hypothetical protein [Patescibacteria group bacterium]